MLFGPGQLTSAIETGGEEGTGGSALPLVAGLSHRRRGGVPATEAGSPGVQAPTSQGFPGAERTR